MSKALVAIVYAAVLILVIAGLTAVTMTALRVERAQQSAQAEAELATKTRLALWRLDTPLYTDLAREADDLPRHYRIRFPADLPALLRSSGGPALWVSTLSWSRGQSGGGPLFFELVATPKASKLPYVKRHYLVLRTASGPYDEKWYEHFGIAAAHRESASDQDSVALASRLAADDKLRERLAEPQVAVAATSPQATVQGQVSQADPDLGLR